jgi:heat shock protein HspQ
VHLSCENKEQENQPTSKVPEKTNITIKKPRLMKNSSKEAVTYQSLDPLIREHREKPRRRPQIGQLPDRLHHTTLDLSR